jgi:lipopolysaccharide transport system permease protein
MLGLSWAVLHPLLSLLVYWWAFGVVAGLPSEGVPYVVFVFSGLIPYSFVTDYLARSVDCFTANNELMQRVYFPRIYFPISMLAVALVDLLVMLGLWLLVLLWYSIPLTAAGLAQVIVSVFFGVCLALGFGLCLASFNVYVRDVSRAMGLINRLVMFASPVFYSRDQVPSRVRWLYDYNPLSGIIEGFRFASGSTDLTVLACFKACLASSCVLVIGLAVFFKLERTLVDRL